MTRRKPSPEEKRAQARDAALRRWHPERYPDAPAPSTSPAGPSGDPQAPLPGHCAYDQVVGRPVTYQDAVQREKAIYAEMENEEFRDKAQVRRGNLFALEQVEKRDEDLAELVFAEFARFVDLVGTLVPPERKTSARQEAQGWVDAARTRIADQISQGAIS